MEEMFKKLFGMFSAQVFVYQHIHWVSKNVVAFQDHLLAERLYGEVSGVPDTLAEKSIGVTGSMQAVDPLERVKAMAPTMKAIGKEQKENAELFRIALQKEQEIIEYCAECEQKAKVSLGFKNLLADLADSAEARVYLLKQRLTK